MGDEINGLEVRPVGTPEEHDMWAQTCSRAFGEELARGKAQWWLDREHLDRTLGVLDDGRFVATGSALPMEVTVPGGQRIRMAGVTSVGVLPSHRRRGLLTGMMERLLRTASDLGEPVAGLWASESAIYGRFGFGWATSNTDLRLDLTRASFRRPPEQLTMRLVEPDEALAVCPPIYERARDRAGMIDRSELHWRNLVEHDPREERHGGGPRFVAALDDRGYVSYRIKQDWNRAGPNHTLMVLELIATDAGTTAALWQWCFGIDLVSRLIAYDRPADDALPHLLQEPRRVRAARHDALWLRVLDVPAALAARRYPVDGRIVLDVTDRFGGWAAGRWALEVVDGVGSCEPTDHPADLALDVEQLGALYLGGTPAGALAAAGQLRERDAGAVQRAALLFGWHEQPWCPGEF